MPADWFDELRDISQFTRLDASFEDEARDRLIRFLDRYPGSTAEVPIVDSLCARFGLYPYVQGSAEFETSEAISFEMHIPHELADEGFVFHSEQFRIYQRLMDGESLLLSAPTSFGKSAILEALVASDRWSNIAVIVPTIALIDETRRKLSRFGDRYAIVTHPSSPLAGRNLLILTQERFLEIPVVPPIDFFMIDEFYKLSGSDLSGDARRTLLNLAWRRLRDSGAQYYLTGPNIEALSEFASDDLQAAFYSTHFRTVAVDVDDRSQVEDREADLHEIVPNLEPPILVFASAVARAEHLGLALPLGRRSELAEEVADWMGETFDQSWNVVRALKNGYAVHSGVLPRSVQRMMVRLFEGGDVERMVCTTTLIEGVNTAAKSVVIYDKAIDRQLIDFFTFSNIQGRAGRMFRHYLGQVVTYMAPPAQEQPIVDLPIETQSSDASSATLIQIPRSEWTEETRRRMSSLVDQQVLSLDAMRANRGIQPEQQLELASKIVGSRTLRDELSWSGFASNDQSKLVLRLAYDYLLSTQRRGMGFDQLWGKLQSARNNAGDFRAMVDQQMRYKRANQDRSDVVNEVLTFQRNWMGFTIPSMIRSVQTIQSEVLPDLGQRPGNYQMLLRDVESLYLPTALMDLEEYGLPFELAVKLNNMGVLGDGSTNEHLAALITEGVRDAVRNQLNRVERWIIDDVIDGLAPGTRPNGD